MRKMSFEDTSSSKINKNNSNDNDKYEGLADFDENDDKKISFDEYKNYAKSEKKSNEKDESGSSSTDLRDEFEDLSGGEDYIKLDDVFSKENEEKDKDKKSDDTKKKSSRNDNSSDNHSDSDDAKKSSGNNGDSSSADSGNSSASSSPNSGSSGSSTGSSPTSNSSGTASPMSSASTTGGNLPEGVNFVKGYEGQDANVDDKHVEKLKKLTEHMYNSDPEFKKMIDDLVAEHGELNIGAANYDNNGYANVNGPNISISHELLDRAIDDQGNLITQGEGDGDYIGKDGNKLSPAGQAMGTLTHELMHGSGYNHEDDSNPNLIAGMPTSTDGIYNQKEDANSLLYTFFDQSL